MKCQVYNKEIFTNFGYFSKFEILISLECAVDSEWKDIIYFIVSCLTVELFIQTNQLSTALTTQHNVWQLFMLCCGAFNILTKSQCLNPWLVHTLSGNVYLINRILVILYNLLFSYSWELYSNCVCCETPKVWNASSICQYSDHDSCSLALVMLASHHTNREITTAMKPGAIMLAVFTPWERGGQEWEWWRRERERVIENEERKSKNPRVINKTVNKAHCTKLIIRKWSDQNSLTYPVI